MKRIALILAAALAAALGIVSFPNSAPTAAADVYTEPGYHTVNGREWRTTCEPYSSNVERCRAEIKATSIKLVGGVFVESTDFVFNNLTYKPSQRSFWKGNPLGEAGEWTTADGRQWRTECDTAATGRNGCRSYILTTVYAVKTMTPRTYEQRNEWVFNNIVQFEVPKPAPTPTPLPGPCNDATLPSGFALTKDGRPYVIKAPYTPVDQYNPTSIGNFIKSVINYHNAIKIKNPADPKLKDQKCLALLAADHLLQGSETSTRVDADGAEHTVRWFPYLFRFSANPEINDLQPPWHSGLAQGGVLATFISLDALTGDAKWLQYGEEAFQSFLVPIEEEGGFVSRENGFLWFEEYPTTAASDGAYGPGTTVLNGHLEAVIGLDLWAVKTGDTDAKALVTEALDDLEPLLSQVELDTDGGIGTSYDLVRGHTAAPLRLVGSSYDATMTHLNGKAIYLQEAGQPSPAGTSLLENSSFGSTIGGVPTKWTRLGSAQYSIAEGGAYRTTSGGNAWQGLQQVVPAGRFTAKAPLSITLDARVSMPKDKAGASGRVAVYGQCSGTTTLLYENVVRGAGWNEYNFGFTAPAAGCDILFQFMLSPYTRADTTVLWDNVELRQAATTALKAPSYDMMVHRTPENLIQLRGTGRATLQAYAENRWQDIQTVDLTSTTQAIHVPERFTGRNIHMGYHETHVSELWVLYKRTTPRNSEEPHPYPFLLEYAQRWAPLAPSTGYQVPLKKDLLEAPPTGAELLQRGDSTISDAEYGYEQGLVDMFTGLPYDELELLEEMQQPAS